jgi:hypothetical protein
VVLRSVEVPLDVRLDRLHLTIQAAMGWTNSHLYGLRAGGVGGSMPDPETDWSGDFLDARKARLSDILEDIGMKTLVYLYDFDDGTQSRSSGSSIPSQGSGYAELVATIKDPAAHRCSGFALRRGTTARMCRRAICARQIYSTTTPGLLCRSRVNALRTSMPATTACRGPTLDAGCITPDPFPLPAVPASSRR